MTREELRLSLVEKCRRTERRIGADLKEFTECHDGDYLREDREKLLPLSHIFNWMQSFFTGEACICYFLTEDPAFLRWNEQFYPDYYRKVFETPLETMHDTGFLYSPYSAAMYQLTGDPNMKALTVKAADELAKRFVPKGGYLRAWGRMDDCVPEYVDSELAKNHFFTESRGLAIVDCMMNIPLLFRASELSGHPYYARIARAHADTTMHYFVREDGSVCHAWRFDEETGASLGEENYCGYGIGSYWARGTAWAIYGFAIAYAYTADRAYYDTAVRLAERFGECCGGRVPIWDFRLPKEAPASYSDEKTAWKTWDITDPANAERVADSSAAAITVCGLDELLKHGENNRLAQLRESLMEHLCAEYVNPDPDIAGILRRQNGSDGYSPFGDYFMMEALANEKGMPRFW